MPSFSGPGLGAGGANGGFGPNGPQRTPIDPRFSTGGGDPIFNNNPQRPTGLLSPTQNWLGQSTGGTDITYSGTQDQGNQPYAGNQAPQNFQMWGNQPQQNPWGNRFGGQNPFQAGNYGFYGMGSPWLNQGYQQGGPWGGFQGNERYGQGQNQADPETLGMIRGIQGMGYLKNEDPSNIFRTLGNVKSQDFYAMNPQAQALAAQIFQRAGLPVPQRLQQAGSSQRGSRPVTDRELAAVQTRTATPQEIDWLTNNMSKWADSGGVRQQEIIKALLARGRFPTEGHLGGIATGYLIRRGGFDANEIRARNRGRLDGALVNKTPGGENA